MLLAELYKFLFEISYNFLPIIFNRPIDIIVVNNDHVKIKWHSAAFNEPLHILTVDDVEVCLLPECRKPLFTAAQHQTVIQPLKVIPLGDLGSPTILTYTDRCDDKNLSNLEAVEHHVVQRRQRYARLA